MEDLPDIDSVTTLFARHFDLTPDETAQAVTYVKQQLVANDYAIIPKHDGQSSLKSFVITVIHRLVGQYRAQRCGAWPGADYASSTSDGAGMIRHLMVRYGFSYAEAVELCRRGGGDAVAGDARGNGEMLNGAAAPASDSDSLRIRAIVTEFVASLGQMDRMLFEAIVFRSETLTDTSRKMRTKTRYLGIRVERLVRRLQAKIRET
jgi:hypothetical protein